jgi:hypothetical protein
MNSTKVRIWRMQAMEAMADAGGGGRAAGGSYHMLALG